LVRDWLRKASGRTTIPGGSEIKRRFDLFNSELPVMCKRLKLEVNELTYNDYTTFVSEWLKNNTNV
jgi:hypothetical protein